MNKVDDHKALPREPQAVKQPKLLIDYSGMKGFEIQARKSPQKS